MSNTLTIELTEFRTRGTGTAHFGYTAYDEHSETFSRVSASWEGVKDAYPTLQSLVDQVLADDAFSDLDVSYRVEGGYVVVDEPEDGQECLLDGIEVVGAEGFY
jgi:hypothetical protein